MELNDLKAPFPYVGGKRRVARVVWERFGDVHSYVEPFCGSAACLLARPVAHKRRQELINDSNGFVANALRSILWAPEKTARHAYHPTCHADLTARHRWLIDWAQGGGLERIFANPYEYDAQAAGWWIWGVSNWISVSDFCQAAFSDSIPAATGSGAVAGVALYKRPPKQLETPRTPTFQVRRPHDKIPTTGGRGVALDRTPFVGPGRGTMPRRATAPGAEPEPEWGLTRDGHLWTSSHDRWIPWMAAISERLDAVYILNKDWSEAINSNSKLGNWEGHTVGVFLDPPYKNTSRTDSLYANDDGGAIAEAVWAWALEYGDLPNFRIAVCAMDGDFDLPEGWTAYHWRSHGLGGAKTEEGRRNEVVLFSPHCLRPESLAPQGKLW